MLLAIRNLIIKVSPLVVVRQPINNDLLSTSAHNLIISRLLNINKKIDYSLFPKLDDNDIEEQLVGGSGPGGSKVNTQRNAVCLKHKPTGIVVKNHESRSVVENRKRAREILLTKLDNYLNGERSVEAQKKAILAEIEIKRKEQRAKQRELSQRIKELYAKGKCSPSET